MTRKDLEMSEKEIQEFLNTKIEEYKKGFFEKEGRQPTEDELEYAFTAFSAMV